MKNEILTLEHLTPYLPYGVKCYANAKHFGLNVLIKELDAYMMMSIFEQHEYETLKRFEWWIRGRFIHCISGVLFNRMPTETICELYNVEITFFRPWQNNIS